MEGLSAILASKPVLARTHREYIEVIQDIPKAIYCIAPWQADPEVPVLYFQLFDEDDSAITDIEKLLAIVRPSPDMAPYISQTEHPVTGLPTFYIHPCNTKTWLADISCAPSSGPAWFLWLQTFGQQVGLLLG